MKSKLSVVAAVALSLLGAGQISTRAGGVFITGHDPDYHALGSVGARHIIQRAIAYVTVDIPNPRILLVTDLRNPGGDQVDSRLGMAAAGFTFDVADYGSGTPGVFDLHTVVFANYEAIVVASDYGGWLRQDELDILNARSAEIIDYINTGKRGVVAFAESGSRPPDTTHDRFGFLPFLVSASPLNQGESGFTLTPEGIALGLVTSDVNGNFSHNVFTGTGGLDVIDRDPLGEILSLATRGVVTVCGVNSTDAELLPYQASGYRYLIIPAGSAPPAGFEQPGFDDSGWSVGGAAFGNASSGCPLLPAIQTDWPPGTELLVRRVVSAPAGTANLRVVVTINNDIVEPFFNGSLIGGSLSQLGCKAPDTNGISVRHALAQAGQTLVPLPRRNAGTNNFFDPRLTSHVPVLPLTPPPHIILQ